MISAFALAGRGWWTTSVHRKGQPGRAFVEDRLIQGGRFCAASRKSLRRSPVTSRIRLLVKAFIDLYEATLERWYLDREKAAGVVDAALELFWDDQTPGFFLTPRGHEELVHRPKDGEIKAIPSGHRGRVQAHLLGCTPPLTGGVRERARSRSWRRKWEPDRPETRGVRLARHRDDGLVHGATEVVLVADEAGRKPSHRFDGSSGGAISPTGSST